MRRRLPGAVAALAAAALALAALAASGAAVAEAPKDARGKPKASSYAPRHTKRRAFGAPVSRQILHKPAKRTPPAPAPPAPLK